MRSLKLILPLILAIFWLTVGCSQQSDEAKQHEKGIVQLEAAAFKSMFSEKPGTVLDVRTNQEVSTGMIESAQHINVLDADFETKVKDLDKTKPVYVYCKSGGRSNRAAKQMQALGFEQIYDLQGGMTAWKAAGYQTVTPK